jgi:3-dehydroquinate dehydratase
VLKYIPKETALMIALQHKERGADICKIVANASNDAELRENFEIIHLLENRLGLKHLTLCNGSHCKKHRRLGPLLGSSLFLATENAKAGQNQPTIAEAIALLKSVNMYTEGN